MNDPHYKFLIDQIFGNQIADSVQMQMFTDVVNKVRRKRYELTNEIRVLCLQDPLDIVDKQYVNFDEMLIDLEDHVKQIKINSSLLGFMGSTRQVKSRILHIAAGLDIQIERL